MNEQKADFIKKITDEIENVFARNKIKRELEAHLDDSVDSLLAQGFDEEQALKISVEKFGDVHEVAEMFNELYPPRNILIILLSILLLFQIMWISIPNIKAYYNFKESSIATDKLLSEYFKEGQQHNLNEIIHYKNYNFTFEKAHLLENKLYLLFEYEKDNKRDIYGTVSLFFDTCEVDNLNKKCYQSQVLPSESGTMVYSLYYPYIKSYGLIVIEDVQNANQIKLLKEDRITGNRVFTLDLEVYKHDK